MSRALHIACLTAVVLCFSACRSGHGAPAGLAGKTLYLEVPVTMGEGLSSPKAGSIPLTYRFRKATVSEKSKGGLTLSYARKDAGSAVATLSGGIPVEYQMTFRGSRQGDLTVKRTAKDGRVSTQKGSFRIGR